RDCDEGDAGQSGRGAHAAFRAAHSRFAERTQTAIWARELTPSLLRILRTWLSTVRSEMNKLTPICLLLEPAATNCATSASRLPSGAVSAVSMRAATNCADSPSASATAAARLNCCPAAYSIWNFDAPSAALADCVPADSRGARTPMRLAPASVRTVSAAPKSRAASRACPELAA